MASTSGFELTDTDRAAHQAHIDAHTAHMKHIKAAGESATLGDLTDVHMAAWAEALHARAAETMYKDAKKMVMYNGHTTHEKQPCTAIVYSGKDDKDIATIIEQFPNKSTLLLEALHKHDKSLKVEWRRTVDGLCLVLKWYM